LPLIEGSLFLLGRVESLPISLGTNVWLLSGFWLFERVSLFLPVSSYICSYGGVDSALIKGEIVNTKLTCPLWFRLMISDCQRIAL
jgi:hypothetical protein